MPTTSALPAFPHSLQRTVLIRAPLETVFSFFQDSTRWEKWWGAGSTIDPKVGGEIRIRHPGGVEADRGKGTNVFLFSPAGRIERVTGFWS
jgi:uncharacterized protein YndB with AHSA1/START domain